MIADEIYKKLSADSADFRRLFLQVKKPGKLFVAGRLLEAQTDMVKNDTSC